MQLLSSLQQRTSWFTDERGVWLALVATAAIIGFGVGNGHTTENSITHIADQYGQKAATVNHLERVVIPKLKADIPKDAAHIKAAEPSRPITSGNHQP